MRLRRIVAPMIVCLAALGCGLGPASASAAPTAINCNPPSSPSCPTPLGSVSDPVHLSGATALAVSGHYAYTTAYYPGELTAVDISNPAQPKIVGHSAPNIAAENGTNIAISGGYAYMVSKNRNGPCTPGPVPNCGAGSNDDGSGNALSVFDIHTDPTTPALVKSIQDPTRLFGAYGIAVQGSFAYIAYQGLLSGQPTTPDASKGGFTVVNISTPTNPTIVGNIDNGALLPSQSNDLWHADSVALDPSGHYAYVTASYSNRLTVIDISNPALPTVVGSLADGTNLAFANDVAIQGNDAYVASQTSPAGRLTVVDISNPTVPRVAGSVLSSSLNQAYRVRVRGGFAYVSSSHADSIAMIDVSSPGNPVVAAVVKDVSHLHHTTGLDLVVTGRYLIASSPSLVSQSEPIYPLFPTQPGGPTATGTVSVLDLDPSPVSLSIRSPGAGVQYQQGQVVNASYSCTPGGLLPIASCAGPVANGAPIDTSRPGNHTFTVTGSDQGGQTARATVTYIVGGPMITGLRQSARKWREHGPKHANHKPPLGTTFTIDLSQSAKLTLMFTQTSRGRLVGGRCVATTKKNRHHRACTRTSTAGKLTMNGHKGSNKVAFAGRVHGRLLRPGRYTLVVTATAGGITSSRHTISFTVVFS